MLKKANNENVEPKMVVYRHRDWKNINVPPSFNKCRRHMEMGKYKCPIKFQQVSINLRDQTEN